MSAHIVHQDGTPLGIAFPRISAVCLRSRHEHKYIPCFHRHMLNQPHRFITGLDPRRHRISRLMTTGQADEPAVRFSDLAQLPRHVHRVTVRSPILEEVSYFRGLAGSLPLCSACPAVPSTEHIAVALPHRNPLPSIQFNLCIIAGWAIISRKGSQYGFGSSNSPPRSGLPVPASVFEPLSGAPPTTI